MRNMLSIEDIKRFFNKNKILVIVTSVIVLVAYVLFSLYNLYSSVMIEERDERYQELSQEEIVEILSREPEDIRAEDLMFIQESLDANAVEFRVFIESQDQSHFNDPALLKDFLIIEEVLDFVEEESGTAIPIDKDLAVLVERRYGHPVLSVNIRTGDLENNLAIAEAYMSAFEEEVIPMIEDRRVYFLDEEPGFFEPRMITQILENLRVYSPLSIVVGSIVSIIIGMVLGTIIAILKGMRDERINEMTILQKYPADKTLALYRLKNEEDIKNQINYAINYPPMSNKVVLTDVNLDSVLHESVDLSSIQVVKDIALANTNKVIDEVIFLTKLDESGRHWYENQRIQLENVDAPVKIIQI